ncbi:MAG: hypothetical protein AB3N13_11175 [Arenibacterium sp.]
MKCSGLDAVNGAVEALTRGLALELGPDVRVNACHGRSEAYDAMSPEARETMYEATGDMLPIGRVSMLMSILTLHSS